VKGVPSVCHGVQTPVPLDTHDQFSKKTLLSKDMPVFSVAESVAE